MLFYILKDILQGEYGTSDHAVKISGNYNHKEDEK